MNAVGENIVKWCVAYLEYQQTQTQYRVLPYEILCRPWEMVSADIYAS